MSRLDARDATLPLARVRVGGKPRRYEHLALLLVGSLALASFAAPLVAQEEPAEQPAPAPIVAENVEGRAAVLNNDLPAAQDEALEDAKQRAVEQVVGVFVSEETLVQQAIVVDEFVRTRAAGYVESYVVTKQPWIDEVGLCRIEITASVRPQIETDLRRDLCAEDEVVVVIPEFVDGEPSPEPVLQNYIVTRLVEAGFRVKDAAQLENIKERDRALALAKGAAQQAAEIGLRFLASTAITGRAEATLVSTRPFGASYTLYTYRARATVRGVKTDTADLLFNKDIFGENVAGLDPQAAAQKALSSVLEQVGEYMLTKMQEHMGTLQHKIQVDIDGVPSEIEFERFKNYLGALRWVEQVEPLQFSTERSSLTIVYAPKTAILARRLSAEKRYQVIDFSPNRILCRYLPPPPEAPAEPSETPPQQPSPLAGN